MFVKVFRIYGAANIESEIQNWLRYNPNIKIQGMAQASAAGSESDKYLYVITIIYTQ